MSQTDIFMRYRQQYYPAAAPQAPPPQPSDLQRAEQKVASLEAELGPLESEMAWQQRVLASRQVGFKPQTPEEALAAGRLLAQAQKGQVPREVLATQKLYKTTYGTYQQVYTGEYLPAFRLAQYRAEQQFIGARQARVPGLEEQPELARIYRKGIAGMPPPPGYKRTITLQEAFGGKFLVMKTLPRGTIPSYPWWSMEAIRVRGVQREYAEKLGISPQEVVVTESPGAARWAVAYMEQYVTPHGVGVRKTERIFLTEEEAKAFRPAAYVKPGPTWKEATLGGWLKAAGEGMRDIPGLGPWRYVFEPLGKHVSGLGLFVGKFEDVARGAYAWATGTYQPPIPTAGGAVTTTVQASFPTVSLRPPGAVMPQWLKAAMPVYTTVAFQPTKSEMLKEFERLPGLEQQYALAGEVAFAWAAGKAVSKVAGWVARTETGAKITKELSEFFRVPQAVKNLFVKYEKIPTERVEFYPGKTTLKTETFPYGLEPLTQPTTLPFTLAHPPVSTKGVTYWYGYAGQEAKQAAGQFYTFIAGKGPTTPFMKTFEAAYGVGAQQLVVQTIVAPAAKVSVQALAETVKVSVIPTVAAKFLAYTIGATAGQARTMMQAWTGAPYPGTAPRVREGVEYAYYTMPGQVQRLAETVTPLSAKEMNRQISGWQHSVDQSLRQQTRFLADLTQEPAFIQVPTVPLAQYPVVTPALSPFQIPTVTTVQRPLIEPIQRERLIPGLMQILPPTQVQVVPPVQITPPVLVPPSPPYVLPPVWLKRGGGGLVGWPGYKRMLRGGWFVREWFMPSPEELRKIMGLKVTKARKAKGKKAKSRKRKRAKGRKRKR